jgi:uncharacterized membrane protein
MIIQIIGLPGSGLYYFHERGWNKVKWGRK